MTSHKNVASGGLSAKTAAWRLRARTVGLLAASLSLVNCSDSETPSDPVTVEPVTPTPGLPAPAAGEPGAMPVSTPTTPVTPTPELPTTMPAPAVPAAPTCSASQLDCSGTCVDPQTDAMHCGACGTACETGQSCTAGACDCDPGLQACGDSCVNTQDNANNCGACGMVCPADAPLCSAGACSSACAATLTQCGQACADLQTSVEHCGGCGMVCGGGQTCEAGACQCSAPGQTACDGVCTDVQSDAANCGACGTVCAAGQSCTAGACVAPATPPATGANCGGKVITPDQLLADFSAGLMSNPGGGRAASLVEGYGDAMGTITTTHDTVEGGPCSGAGSMRVTATGFSQWGSGFGVNMFAENGVVAPKKVYDASAYTGFGFYMNCTQAVEFVLVKALDQHTDGLVENGSCAYDGSKPGCREYGIKNAVVHQGWQYYEVLWSDFLQDTGSAADSFIPPTGGFDPSLLTSVQIQMNPTQSRTGAAAPNDYECWLDDVHFVTNAAPVFEKPADCGACMKGQTPVAPGGYYVEGNKFKDFADNDVVFRGLARPSLEWDLAGNNITREDVFRMRSEWKSNMVRYSLNQEFWLDAATGPIYQAYVDRAVRWGIEAGMAVVLDLHWSMDGNPIPGLPSTTAGQREMADADSITFWQQVAEKYKDDGRVMFELYNEPFVGDIGVWRNGNLNSGGPYAGMQQLYDAVRGTGAHNVVMIGGIDFAYDLSALSQPANRITGYNISYVTHPYVFKGNKDYDSLFGFLVDGGIAPVIATEGGAGTTDRTATQDCSPGFYDDFLGYFNSKGISYTGWAWHVDETYCGFPTLLENYLGVPNPAGEKIRADMAKNP